MAGCSPSAESDGGADNTEAPLDIPSVAIDPDDVTHENFEEYIRIEEIPEPDPEATMPQELEALMQKVQSAANDGSASAEAERIVFGIDDNNDLFMLATTSDGLLKTQLPFDSISYKVFIKAPSCTINGSEISFDGKNINEGSVIEIAVTCSGEYQLNRIDDTIVTEEQLAEIEESESEALKAVKGVLSSGKIYRADFSTGMRIGATSVIGSAYMIWDGRSNKSFRQEKYELSPSLDGYSEITTYVYSCEGTVEAVCKAVRGDNSSIVYKMDVPSVDI